MLTCSEANSQWQYCTVCHWYCLNDGVFGNLSQYTIPILSSIPSPCITPLHVVWPIVVLIIILLLLRPDVLKFSGYVVIVNLLTHIFRRKCDPSQSIFASAYNINMLRQNRVSDNNFMLADKSTCRKLCFLFWNEDISFLGHAKWGTKQSGIDQISTVKDTRSQVIVAVNRSGSHLSLCMHELTHKQCWYNPVVHPVLTSRVYFFHSDTHWSLSTRYWKIELEQQW